jgi:biopolymer transport protein ExbB
MKILCILIFSCVSFSALARYAGADVSPETSLTDALNRLALVREQIAEERVPLAKRLNALESTVIELRREAARQRDLRDSGGLDLSTLEADLSARQEEFDYISGLVTEFLSSVETRADPVELAEMRDALDRALSSIDNNSLELTEQISRQMDGIELGLTRIQSVGGGRQLRGTAVGESGELLEGEFLLFGPVTYFSAPGQESGISIRGDTDVPLVIPAGSHTAMIEETIREGKGLLPLDPTLGKAIAIASTEETLVEHILKGGIWIFPILFAAGLALTIALFKFLQIYGIKQVSASRIREIVSLIREDRTDEARKLALSLPSPGSELLLAGVESADEPKELLEEILLEKIVEQQPRMERLLPVIAVTAATAPLLGLLGTVTGMINTFKLITLFGTGDAKSLSSGISEALITTEFGLIVAIPALILHAILSRKAKSILSGLEANAMTFVNVISAKQNRTD